MFVIHSEYFTFMVRSDYIVADYLMMDFCCYQRLSHESVFTSSVQLGSEGHGARNGSTLQRILRRMS